MITFSIIIPTYNQLPLLKRALESVLHQQGADYEVIVTDDSDNDEICTYIEALDKQTIKYFHHNSTGRAADNWNFGLSKAEGKFVIVMHHDEAMSSRNHLNMMAQALADADVAIADVEVMNGGKQSSRWLSHLTKKFFCKHPEWLFLQNAIGPTACVAFKRNQLQPFNPDLKWLVDIEWYYRLLKGKRVSICKACKVQSTHGHAGQISQQMDILQAFKQDKAIIRQTHGNHVRLMLWLYEHLILGTKRLLRRI
ncbi:MAG: glycosyltransferase family 2 protein [Prevotella sp.]|nr:glycosyltransferase family 2 protein [Prevotella sp.]